MAAGVPAENVLYLGGPNIAAEVYNREYANARICGSEKWRKPLARFLRQPHFVVWDNSDLTTHEVMGGLKNVYAIGAGKPSFVILVLRGAGLYKTVTKILMLHRIFKNFHPQRLPSIHAFLQSKE